MKNSFLTLVAMAFIAFQCNAQTESSENFKKFKLSDFQFAGYFTTYSPQLVDYNTIGKLAVNADELQLPADIANYTRRVDSQEGSQGTAAIYASIALNPFNKKKGEYNEKQVWRMGLTFRDINTYESAYNISIPTGIDSVSQSRDYFVNAGLTALMVETSYSFATDPKKPLQAFIGLGTQFGFSLSSNLEINSNENIITDLPDDVSETVFTPNNFNVSGQNSILWGVYVPAGVHIRLRKNLGVLTELRYGIGGNNSSASGTSFTRTEFFAGVGLRYTLGAFDDNKNSTGF
ncbi:MAG: hypothetical protein WED33_09535 [Bacteroidia bacterium]